MSWPLSQHGVEHCHAAKSLYRVSRCIATVCLSMARLKRINCVRYRSLVIISVVLTVHNTLRRAGPTKYRAWPWSMTREYSVWPSTWKHGRELPMIFCAWDYRNEPIFHPPQSQYDAEILSVFAFQAAVHKQTNAVQHLSASIRTAPNFLASESFPWLWGVLKWLVGSLLMIVPILLDFDTNLAQVPPILHLLSSTATPVFDIKITILETTHHTFFH